MRKVIGSFLILAAVLLNRPGLSATLTVISTADSGPGSLRQALATAAAGDTIDFSVTGTIMLTSGELLIDKSLTVMGPGADNLSVERSTAAGTPDFRIFNVQSGVVVLSGTTLSHGRAALGGGLHSQTTLTLRDCIIKDNAATQRGGGIDNAGSTLTLSNCVISENAASSAGGGAAGGAYGGGLNNSGGTVTNIHCFIISNTASVLADNNSVGGGIFSDGSLYMTNSVISGNTASGITNVNASGGGIFSQGELNLNQSTIAFNAAIGGSGTTGAAGQGGGLFSAFGTATLLRSTVSGNSAVGGSGVTGGPAQGGGIGVDRSTAIIQNSTVSGNSAEGGSGTSGIGMAQGGGVWNSSLGSLSVDHSTITSNTVPGLAGGLPGLGGGLFNSGNVESIRNTILAGNTSVDLLNEQSGNFQFQSAGFNLFGSTNGPTPTGPNDQFNLTAAALRLGPLQDNGGPTFTHALLCGSPAIDAGDTNNAPATDQRGFGFPRIVGTNIDIGSYEAANLDTAPPIITSTPPGGDLGCNPSPATLPTDDSVKAGTTATDNSGTPTVIVSHSDATAGCITTRTFTITAVDACTNTSAPSTVVYHWKVDTTSPVLTGCPDLAASYQCLNQVPPAPTVTASDDCDGVVVVSFNETSSGTDCHKAISRIWTATDTCSNSASCTQIITVSDTNAPVITQCPADVTVSCASQIPPPNDAGVVASDNCSGPVTVTHGSDTTTPGSCPGRFTVSRVYTASDLCSNSASCTQTITVNDTNAPVITQCAADVTVSCASQIPPPNDAEVLASDNCAGPVTVTHGPDTITPGSCPGKYTVSRVYTASDSCSNSVSCTQTITVNDTNAPVITQCPADVTVSCASQIPPPNDAGVAASDDCGGPVTVTHGPDTTTPGSCSGKYTVSRVYTASDSCSNSVSCTQTITVNDTNPPVITQCPADVTVSCASQIPPPNDAGLVASDNCGGPVTVTHGPDTITPGSCPGRYTVSRTYTASDACSNSVSCTQTITVNDTNAPVITQCPANVTVSCASQIPPPDDAGVVASDDCGGPVTVTHGPDTITPGSCPGRYTVSRTYTASDACSNSASCTQVITVNDTNAPVITQCPANVTVSCASQIPPPDDAGVVASDDCGGPVTVTHGPDTITPGSCPGKYTVSRTYTASDACSNSVSCTQTITVNDTNAPVITQCPADATVSCTAQIPPPSDGGVVATDNCGGPVTVTHGPDMITPGSCPGKYTVTRIYTASDSCSNSVSCTQTITVNDTNAPVITQCPADATVSCTAQIPPPSDGGVVATDNCGGPVTVTHGPDMITPGSCPGKYTVTRIYTASDSCSNSVSCTQTITVNDTNPPVITHCPADVTVSCTSQVPPADDSGVVASDDCGGPVTVTHSPDTITPGSCPGKFTVSRTYTAADPCGNSASCTQTITINDTNPPVIMQCPANVTVSCASQIPLPNDAGVVANDNCGGPVTVTHGLDTTTPGSCPGKFTVSRTYTASDACSNSASCTQTITVNDTNPPVITSCPADVTVSCASQVPPPDDSGVTAADDCGGPVTVTHGPDTITPGSCPGKYTVRRTYTVRDACSNSNSCTQTITVNDTTPPVITCVGNKTNQCGLGNLAFDTPTATDNCGTVTIAVLKTETNSVGGHKILVTRTWSATDPCGNTSTCSQTISTTDSTALTIACPNPLVLQCASPTGAVATVSVSVSDANGEALVVVWSVDGTAKQTNTVPAGKPTTTATVAFTANFVVGSHQVTASVSNVSGCQTSCSTSVTVLGAGDLYPIAMSSRTIAGVPIGTVLKDIYNGAQPGNFGWLTWAGSPSEPTLVTSLTPPGDSRTYINPQNPNDHVVSIGDWVRGKPGLSNSDQVRKSLNVLETIDITVPVWDRAKGKGSGTQYHVVGFARVRLISYQLNKQNRITARFLGLVNCN